MHRRGSSCAAEVNELRMLSYNARVSIRDFVHGARPQTLPLAIAPVAIGAACAYPYIFDVNTSNESAGHIAVRTIGQQHFTLIVVLCALVALFLQIAANYMNDYSDGIRGTDEHRATNLLAHDSVEPIAAQESAQTSMRVQTRANESSIDRPQNSGNIARHSEPLPFIVTSGIVTPIPVGIFDETSGSDDSDAAVSHGPTRLVASGVPAHLVLRAALTSAALAALAGVWLTILTQHWWFILVGAACIAAAWWYVGGKHPYGYRGFGEPAAFIFFGPVPVLLTMFALCGRISWQAAYGSLTIGLIALIVLSINNLRDISDDRLHDKRTWIVSFGYSPGNIFVRILLLIIDVLIAGLLWYAMHSPVIDDTLAAWQVFGAGAAILASLVMAVGTITFVSRMHYAQAMRWTVLVGVLIACIFICFAPILA